MSVFGDILSLILDYSPFGVFKSIFEGISGYNSVTFEKLDDTDRVMCFVGLIPYIGKIAGGVVGKLIKSAKALKRVTAVIRGVSVGAKVLDIRNDFEGAREIKEKIKKEGGLIRLAEKNISDTFDFVRYDDGTTASSVRAIGTVACAIVSPIVNVPKNLAKQIYYGVNSLLGKSEEEIEKSLDDISQHYEKAKDKLIDKMIDTGLNVRFINDIVSPFKTVIDYYNIASLSPEELDRYLAFDREKTYRYKNNSKNDQGSNGWKFPFGLIFPFFSTFF